MTVVVVVLAVAAAADLAYARFKPLKIHKRCGGRGFDARCKYTGKVPRFGARWVHPDYRRK